MNIQQAINIFKNKYPDKKITGYWQDGDNIILNIKPQYGPLFLEPGQFIIQSSGAIIPTNPVDSDVVANESMIKL